MIVIQCVIIRVEVHAMEIVQIFPMINAMAIVRN